MIISLLAPHTCLLCGRSLVSGERGLCLTCLSQVPECPLPGHRLRLERLDRRMPVAAVVTWLAYSNRSAFPSLLRRGKFGGRPDIIALLARQFAARVAARGDLRGVDVLVPVPMHWTKRLRRGFNQASIIARELSRATGIPVVDALGARRGHSPLSRSSGAAARAAGIAGCFTLRRPEALAGLHVAVVDDILTTGATLSEAISTMMPARPAAVTAVILAATC